MKSAAPTLEALQDADRRMLERMADCAAAHEGLTPAERDAYRDAIVAAPRVLDPTKTGLHDIGMAAALSLQRSR